MPTTIFVNVSSKSSALLSNKICYTAYNCLYLISQKFKHHFIHKIKILNHFMKRIYDALYGSCICRFRVCHIPWSNRWDTNLLHITTSIIYCIFYNILFFFFFFLSFARQVLYIRMCYCIAVDSPFLFHNDTFFEIELKLPERLFWTTRRRLKCLRNAVI